ncbi:MAG: DsbA family oxidoreductase [Bacteroidetes bacterium]|nr:DsbA family oxidoreductase [Bacteroidota bacterium]
MKIEIWSDMMCPFCYIGKRRFEAALAQFEHKDCIEISWKSFQLNPDMVTQPDKNIHQYLADIKGWSLEQSRSMNAQVTDMAMDAGLHYDFEKAIVANTFQAHRLLQFAKSKNLGDAAEERMFKAYFTDGLNLDDTDTLLKLGKEIGLNASETEQILKTNAFAGDVKNDIQEAMNIGVRGVPFFVIDRKYAVSGAQQPETFLGALERAWNERTQA